MNSQILFHGRASMAQYAAKLLAGLLILATAAGAARAADFGVSTPNSQFAFLINGVNSNPTLTVTRGQTYTFAISTAGFHPFEIQGATTVTNNNISSGTITFGVPLTGPSSYNYICSVHGFGGVINVLNPPPPPVPIVKIISVTLTPTNVTLLSTGTNGYSPVPMFSSNLFKPTLWAVVPGFSNTYNQGTNKTVFNRLETICGPNVYLRVNNTN